MTLTREQVYKAVIGNNYIAIRWTDGDVTGVNCRVGMLAARDKSMDDTPTSIIGYFPITFQEYIRIKTPYMKSKNLRP